MAESIQASYAIAFTAGVLSFLSPCILPLVPSYFSFMTGMALSDLTGRKEIGRIRVAVFVNAVAFVIGFTMIFVSLGATATVFGQWLQAHQIWLKRIGGLLVILFGLQVAGVLKLKWLEQEKRLALRQKPAGLLGSALLGVVFAVGWSPCIGPILASILTLAATQETAQDGIKLLTLYSLGLGLPFIIGSLAINGLLGLLQRFRTALHWVSVVSGWFLVLVGVAIFTDYLTQLTGYLILWWGSGWAQ